MRGDANESTPFANKAAAITRVNERVVLSRVANGAIVGRGFCGGASLQYASANPPDRKERISHVDAAAPGKLGRRI